MANQSKYQYVCSEGNPPHQIYSEQEYTKCPVISLGVPCKGKLTRFGPGSKAK